MMDDVMMEEVIHRGHTQTQRMTRLSEAMLCSVVITAGSTKPADSELLRSTEAGSDKTRHPFPWMRLSWARRLVIMQGTHHGRHWSKAITVVRIEAVIRVVIRNK